MYVCLVVYENQEPLLLRFYWNLKIPWDTYMTRVVPWGWWSCTTIWLCLIVILIQAILKRFLLLSHDFSWCGLNKCPLKIARSFVLEYIRIYGFIFHDISVYVQIFLYTKSFMLPTGSPRAELPLWETCQGGICLESWLWSGRISWISDVMKIWKYVGFTLAMGYYNIQ